MLATLNAQIMETRLDAKYGARRRCTVTKTESTAIDEPMASTVRFCPLPKPSVVGVGAYTPRPTSLDARRKAFVDTYIDCPDLQDVRHICTVPASLTSIARWGMRDVVRPGPVHVGGDVVALVSSRQVGALLVEVTRNTSDLPSHKCTRLVMHMCTNDAIAREWLECFGY